MALNASIGHAADQKNPLPFNDDTVRAGARIFKQNCAVCHGITGQPATLISKGMFPPPPQLFEKQDMVTDDPLALRGPDPKDFAFVDVAAVAELQKDFHRLP